MSDMITAEVTRILKRLRSETEAASRTEAADMIEALHAQLADAKAAQAMVVERAAEEVRGSNLGLDINDIADDVLALADTDGLALVQALRAERDELRNRVRWNIEESGDLVRVCRGDHEKGEDCSAHEDRFVPEADRDRLAAANAALEAQVARLVGVLGQVGFRLGAARQTGSLNTGWHDLEAEIAAALAEVQADARREGGE